MNNNYTVYIHNNKINNKKYIGITKQQPKNRWGRNGCNYKESPHFWNAIQKYGWINFDHIIFKINLTKEEACALEKELILQYKTQEHEFGYNIFEGGQCPSIPKETRNKMSQSMKGNKNGLGKKCSEEKKLKISLAQKGRKLTEEHKQKLSMAKKGKSHNPPSEETRKKISNSHEKNKVICIETNIIYESIQDCARQLGLYATNVCKCCKHKIKTTGGYHFEYYNDIINA